MVHSRKRRSLRGMVAWVALSVGGFFLAVTVIIFMFGRLFLNDYGKGKIERAYGLAHPGCTLRIGTLDHALCANRTIAQSVTLSGPNTTLKVGWISLTGVRWSRLLWEPAALANILAQTSLEATNLEIDLPQIRYVVHCERLRASVRDSDLLAEGTELRTSVGEEEFFAADASRTTRFHLVVPECRILGLAYSELLEGKSYRAHSVLLSRLAFEALVNRDKPVGPFRQSPLMLREALAAIPQPIHLDSLTITNGDIRYCERLAAGAAPGVLTFAAVDITAEGLANRDEVPAAILLRGQGNFMNAGVLKVLMTIPVGSSDLSLHYSGSLGAMDLTRLNAFLEIAEHTRIKSGDAQEVAFDIDVSAGQARGQVRGAYMNLKIAFLDKQTGSAAGVRNLVTSFLANTLKIRTSNSPDGTGLLKEGQVAYSRKPEDEFLQFAWFALRTGVLDVISR